MMCACMHAVNGCEVVYLKQCTKMCMCTRARAGVRACVRVCVHLVSKNVSFLKTSIFCLQYLPISPSTFDSTRDPKAELCDSFIADGKADDVTCSAACKCKLGRVDSAIAGISSVHRRFSDDPSSLGGGLVADDRQAWRLDSE